MSTPDIQIAGWKTVLDWQAFRAKLLAGGDRSLWLEAAHDYFYERLSLRYLHPITLLQEHGTFQGEGFSIVAIQCTLIEFLESTALGLNYRYVRKGEHLGPNEYSNSGELFTSFLCQRQPFAKDFDEKLARDFYEGVRCGLLHEARTKNGWRIWGEGPSGPVISAATKTVYRNNFQAAILEFITWYQTELPSDVSLQQAFIRKFDGLCQ